MDPPAEPEYVTIQLLREITDDFSEGRVLGRGAFGVVYRGTTRNGDDVAVKILKVTGDTIQLDLAHKNFQNEFENLKNLKHQNIVQVFGYCYETTEGTPLEFNGRIVQTVNVHRALCMEYMHNGSLDKFLSDKSHELEWLERYTIIKGICQGLKYIHDELEKPLYHLDLKPHNILLDKDMVPKIADFGISRPVSRKGITITTETPQGTLGYQPPEHINRDEISDKFDIFSLGVIMINILSAPEGHSIYENCKDFNEANDDLVSSIVQNWELRWQATTPRIHHSLVEAYRDQGSV